MTLSVEGTGRQKRLLWDKWLGWLVCFWWGTPQRCKATDFRLQWRWGHSCLDRWLSDPLTSGLPCETFLHCSDSSCLFYSLFFSSLVIKFCICIVHLSLQRRSNKVAENFFILTMFCFALQPLKDLEWWRLILKWKWGFLEMLLKNVSINKILT